MKMRNKASKNNMKNPTATPFDIEQIIAQTVNHCTNSFKFDSTETRSRSLCLPRDHAERDLSEDSDEEFHGDLDALKDLPLSELKKPCATRFTCERVGSVLAIKQNLMCYISLSDISRYSKLSSEDLHQLLHESQFIKLSLIGAGGVINEFVNWDAALTFCAPAPLGCMLIAWMEQIILPEILGGRDYADGIPTKLFYRLIGEDIEFDEWQDQFMNRRFPECPPPNLTNSEGIHISVGCAKDHLIEDASFVSLLNFIHICEAEATPGDYPNESFFDFLLVAGSVHPDSNDRIHAQILHYFLKFTMPFEQWISAIFERYGHTQGVDYVKETGVEDGQEDILLTVSTALAAAMATPTPRGQALKEYCIAAGLATPVPRPTCGDIEKTNPQPIS